MFYQLKKNKSILSINLGPGQWQLELLDPLWATPGSSTFIPLPPYASIRKLGQWNFWNLDFNVTLNSSPTSLKCLPFFLLLNVATKVNGCRSCWWDHCYTLLWCYSVFSPGHLASLSTSGFEVWNLGKGSSYLAGEATLNLLIIQSWFIVIM